MLDVLFSKNLVHFKMARPHSSPSPRENEQLFTLTAPPISPSPSLGHLTLTKTWEKPSPASETYPSVRPPLGHFFLRCALLTLISHIHRHVSYLCVSGGYRIPHDISGEEGINALVKANAVTFTIYQLAPTRSTRKEKRFSCPRSVCIMQTLIPPWCRKFATEMKGPCRRHNYAGCI